MIATPSRLDETNLYSKQWDISEPILVFESNSNRIYRVIYSGNIAALKIFIEPQDQIVKRSTAALAQFNGLGAVQIYNADNYAQLMEYVEGDSLQTLVDRGDDNEATMTAAQVIEKLHRQRHISSQSLDQTSRKSNPLISMQRHFKSLLSSNTFNDPTLLDGAKLAAELIATERETVVLHADMHHGNVLKSSKRGWLAIDPQGVFGERTYDTANVFFNPKSHVGELTSTQKILTKCQIFERQLGMDHKRILKFAFAHGCLSATWSIEDGEEPTSTLAIARSIQKLL